MSSQTSGPLARGAGAGCANARRPPAIVATAAAPVVRWRNRRRGSVMASPPGIHALPAPHIRTRVDYDACRNARRDDVAYWHSLLVVVGEGAAARQECAGRRLLAPRSHNLTSANQRYRVPRELMFC